MALTQVPIELSSTPGIVDNSNATAITIDSSENVLVGKTSVGQAIVGCELRSDRAVVTRDGGTPLTLNRLTSPGSILELLEDGTTVGSIGSNGGDVYIGTGDTTIRFVDGDDAIIPRGTAGAVRDGAIDLGISNNRFKDIYLSGGVNFSANANAAGMTSELLDDYEEGTFTLTISSSGFTVASQTNTYTKIGNTVSIRGRILFSAVLSNGSSVVLTGAPFACNSSIHGVGVARETTTSGDIFTAQVSAGSTTFAFTSMDGITVGSNQVLLANKTYDYQVTYQT